MFDDVPLRAWLLILLAMSAWGPAHYVYFHLAHSPSRRDITQPPEDLGWRTSWQLIRNAALLAALAACAIFIFTPAAEALAASPQFVPGLLLTLGAATGGSVLRALRTGTIEPLVNGVSKTFERTVHPKRYWASIGWNAALGCLLIWLAYQMNEEASAEAAGGSCELPADFDAQDGALSACDELIRLRPDDPAGYMTRGLIYLDALAVDSAAADFTEAHRLDPDNLWPLANRGLAAAWKKDPVGAEKDFRAVRSRDPGNPVMLRGEAILRKDAGDIRGAVDRLTASMVRDPANLWALRTRAELLWELDEYDKSAEDDARWVALKKRAAMERSGQPPEHGSH